MVGWVSSIPADRFANAGFTALVAGHHTQQAQSHRVRQRLQLGRQLDGRFSRSGSRTSGATVHPALGTDGNCDFDMHRY